MKTQKPKLEIEEAGGPMLRAVFHVAFPVRNVGRYQVTDDGRIVFASGESYKLADVARAAGIVPRKDGGRNDGGWYNWELCDEENGKAIFVFEVDVINAHVVDVTTGEKLF